MKLELKHLAPYLPYGLMGTFEVADIIKTSPKESRPKKLRIDNIDFFLDFCTPILRPLSDLTRKELETQGFWHHIDHLTHEKGNSLEAPYFMVEYLLSKHYDIYGLIKEGLAIDINTL